MHTVGWLNGITRLRNCGRVAGSSPVLTTKKEVKMNNYIKRYRTQNTKGLSGIVRIIRIDLTNLKLRIKYLYLKYIKYPLKGI